MSNDKFDATFHAPEPDDMIRELDDALAKNDGRVVPIVFYSGGTAHKLGDAKVVKDDQGLRIDAVWDDPQLAADLFAGGEEHTLPDADWSFGFNTEDMQLREVNPLLRPIYKTDKGILDG